MAVVRSKFAESQLAQRKSQGRALSGGWTSSPMVKILQLCLIPLIAYLVGGFLLWSDLKAFISEKPLALPKVAQLHKSDYELIKSQLYKGFLQKKSAAVTLQELNSAMAGSYDDTQVAPGTPVPSVAPSIYSVDKKGNLIVLFSVPMGAAAQKHVGGVLLFTPSKVPVESPTAPRLLELTKVHSAENKPLSEAQVRRVNRLLHVAYEQVEGFSARLYASSERRGQASSHMAGDPNKKLEIKYANSTLYFNKYEP